MYANHLKKIRQSLDLSIAKMSKKLDMSASTLTSYERGERTPSVEFLTRLYKIFNINTNWFVSGEGEIFNNFSLTTRKLSDIDDEFKLRVEAVLRSNGLI